jgi:hypothetical protein
MSCEQSRTVAKPSQSGSFFTHNPKVAGSNPARATERMRGVSPRGRLRVFHSGAILGPRGFGPSAILQRIASVLQETNDLARKKEQGSWPSPSGIETNGASAGSTSTANARTVGAPPLSERPWQPTPVWGSAPPDSTIVGGSRFVTRLPWQPPSGFGKRFGVSAVGGPVASAQSGDRYRGCTSRVVEVLGGTWISFNQPEHQVDL